MNDDNSVAEQQWAMRAASKLPQGPDSQILVRQNIMAKHAFRTQRIWHHMATVWPIRCLDLFQLVVSALLNFENPHSVNVYSIPGTALCVLKTARLVVAFLPHAFHFCYILYICFTLFVPPRSLSSGNTRGILQSLINDVNT